jgi:signal transduction histidine kinase
MALTLRKSFRRHGSEHEPESNSPPAAQPAEGTVVQSDHLEEVRPQRSGAGAALSTEGGTGVGEAGPSAFVLPVVAAAGLGLSAMAMAIALSTPGPGDRALAAVGRALVVAVPVGVGVWAWRRRPDDRFGRLLVAAGFVWFLPTLAESSNDVVYSAGRVGAWLAEPVLVFVMLAFPSGRLMSRLERGVVWAAVSTVALLYLPSALIVERYPQPVPYTSCRLDCPDNAFMLLDAQPDFVDAWLLPVRDLIAVLVFVAVLLLLARRIRRSTKLMRRALVPVLAIALLRAAVFIVYVPLRQASPESPILDPLGWIYLLCLPGMAVGFLVGLVRSQLEAGEALQRLAVQLRDHPGPGQVTSMLRRAMDDPSLELAFWVDGRMGWVDADGRRVQLPERGSGRCMTEVTDGAGRVAAVIHDVALRDQQEYVDAAASLAGTALENQRLVAQVDASLQELSESRARIQAAADSERRRIERDLHDGAQQRLVALRIRLELAAETVRDEPGRGAGLMRELGVEAQEALEEVRLLAHGVYPSLLTDKGLGEALRALGRRSLLPTSVETQAIGRYSAEIESTVYFCCLEAIQNADKHAGARCAVSISLSDDGGELRFEVSDDGAGFAAGAFDSGNGFTNMHDRVAAVRGTLTIQSAPGGGTVVAGAIPLSPNGRVVASSRERGPPLA